MQVMSGEADNSGALFSFLSIPLLGRRNSFYLLCSIVSCPLRANVVAGIVFTYSVPLCPVRYALTFTTHYSYVYYFCGVCTSDILSTCVPYHVSVFSVIFFSTGSTFY